MLVRSADLIDAEAPAGGICENAKIGSGSSAGYTLCGAETMQAAARSGITILAIEADAVMLADDLQILTDICTNSGMTLVGISATAAHDGPHFYSGW